MLSSLHIQNVAVIKKLNMDFNSGFSVLSGETGAGKSIILDSVHLLLGARTNKDLIRSGEERAVVSAIFQNLSSSTVSSLSQLGVEPDEEGMLELQRTVYSDGRSQIKLCGQTITQALLRKIGACLITIHGQNDQQSILDRANHIAFLDDYAHDEDALLAYKSAYENAISVRAKLQSVKQDENEKNRLSEILKFQIDDIESAHLKLGEEERLTEQKKKIQNLERITKQIKFVYKALYRNEKIPSAFELLQKSSDMLSQISDIIPKASEYSEKLETIAFETEEIANSVFSYLDDGGEDADILLDKIEGRLEIISKLKRKYGANEAEILDFLKQKKDELSAIERSDEYIRQYTAEYRTALVAAEKAATELSDIRHKAAKELCRQIEERLAFLDMENVRFIINISKEALSSSGFDAVEFFIQTNAGEEARPLEKIASGGELSRIMLAIKSVMRNRNSTDTIIFDEIDTGVSGKNAEKIGILLHESAQDCQIICVTHSAQVAAKADYHYRITKKEEDGRTETEVCLLDFDGRVEEISRIMGGIKISETIRQSAREALMNSKKATNTLNIQES